MKYLFVYIFSTFCFAISMAQNKAEMLQDTINNQLELLVSFPQTLYEEDQPSFDPDSLSKIIADNIVEYIEEVGFDHFNQKNFSLLEFDNDSINSIFSVISFSYHSGGSAGEIPTSIMVKKNTSSYKIYRIPDLEARFYEFHHLIGDTYLCFASIPGWGMCANQGIFAFEFKDEAIPVRVFGLNSAISFCFANFSFDNDKKLLTIEIDGTPSNGNFIVNEKGMDYFSVDKSSTDDDGLFIGTLYGKFDGKKFVKP